MSSGTGTRQKNRSCLPPTWRHARNWASAVASNASRGRMFLFFRPQRPPFSGWSASVRQVALTSSEDDDDQGVAVPADLLQVLDDASDLVISVAHRECFLAYPGDRTLRRSTPSPFPSSLLPREKYAHLSLLVLHQCTGNIHRPLALLHFARYSARNSSMRYRTPWLVFLNRS
jgi:hypothetical protein